LRKPRAQTPGVVRALAVDYSDRFVFAGLSSGALATYQFTGSPQPLGQTSLVDAGTSPRAIALSASGRQVWVVNGDDTLSTFFFDQLTGGLTAGPVVSTGGQGANALAVHPSGRFVFVSHGQSNELRRYGLDDAGVLAFEAQTPVGGSPVGVLADPSGRFLFVLNHQSQELQSFSVAAAGALSLVQSVRTEVGATGFSLMRGAPITFESTTG
jgi:6-phosphogluconolactonase (cycloisomerase 2 family)